MELGVEGWGRGGVEVILISKYFWSDCGWLLKCHIRILGMKRKIWYGNIIYWPQTLTTILIFFIPHIISC